MASGVVATGGGGGGGGGNALNTGPGAEPAGDHLGTLGWDANILLFGPNASCPLDARGAMGGGMANIGTLEGAGGRMRDGRKGGGEGEEGKEDRKSLG